MSVTSELLHEREALKLPRDQRKERTDAGQRRRALLARNPGLSYPAALRAARGLGPSENDDLERR